MSDPTRNERTAPSNARPQDTASQIDEPTAGLEAASSSNDDFSFLEKPQASDELGRLGPFRVLKELGRGGMGCVFLAEDTGLERKVALKVMLPQFARDQKAKTRFLREARAAGKLHHDNVVAIHQVGEANSVPFIAMEFLKGMPLDKYLKDKGDLSLPTVLRIGREIALGLAEAHKLGMIHRDIKPANVWLEALPAVPGRKPGGFRVKILDFGLARREEDGEAHLTQSGAIVGTPAYMAPEQATGEKVDARADLFSLGVLLYRLATGTPAFTGPTTVAMLMAVANHEPPSASDVKPTVPVELARVIAKLMAKKKEDRYASAAELLADWERLPKVARAETATTPSPAKTSPFREAKSQATRPEPASAKATQIADPPSTSSAAPPRRSSTKWLLAVAAGFLGISLLAWQIVIRLTDEKGNVKEIEVNKGMKIEIVQKPEKKGDETPTPPTPSPTTPTKGSYGLVVTPHEFAVAPNPGLDATKPWTAEAYLTPLSEAALSNSTIFNRVVGIDGAFGLGVIGNKYFGYSHHGEGQGGVAKVGERVHLACVQTEKERLIFVNGKLVASSMSFLRSENPKNVDLVFKLLFPADGASVLVDNLRISQAERYQKDFPPPGRFEPDKFTLALYRLDEGSGDTFSDSSGHGHHGKIVGAKWVKADGSPLAKTVVPWKTLLDAKLSGWSRVDDQEPDAITVSELEGEAVVRFRKNAGQPFAVTVQEFGNHHLAMEFQFPPGKGQSRFKVGPSKGTPGSMQVGITSNGSSAGHPVKALASAGVLERGVVVAQGARAADPVNFASLNLNPSGAWNRLDLVRLDDSLACFVNGRFVGALASVRLLKDGKEIEFGKTNILVQCTNGEVLFRRIEVSNVSALPPELTSGPWQPMLDAKLTHWKQDSKNQPDVIGVAAPDGEPVLLIKGDGRPHLHSKTLYQNSHLRLEFVMPNKGPTDFHVSYGWPGGKSTLQFHVSESGKTDVYPYGLSLSPANLTGGGLISTGKTDNKKFAFADSSLNRDLQWNRLDLVRDGDRAALFVNGRFLGAVAELRASIDGKSTELGSSGITLGCSVGQTLIRRVEIRDINALPAELLEPSR